MAEITIKKGNTLGGLAGQYGTTVSDLLKSNPSITNPNLIQAGGKLVVPDATNVGTPSSGTVTAPNLSNTFSTADLAKTPTPTVPTPEPAPAVDPFIASLQASQKQIADLTASYNKPVEQAQADRTTLTERLAKSLESFTGKGAAITAQQQALGVPENIKKLTDLNAQIAQRTGEYDKLSASLEGQGRGLTTGLVTGQQGAVARQKAVEIGALSSVAQALQGNIALAKQTAEDTVNLEFSDKEQEIKNLQTLLDLNKDTLTSAEKKQADQLAQTLAERTRLLDQQKQDRKDVLSLIPDAIEGGASNEVLSQMTKAKNIEEALNIGGPALRMKYEYKRQADLLDSKYKKAQIANIESEIANRGLKETQDPANILAYAQQYASTGQIPTGLPKDTFGLVSQTAKELPQQEGSVVNTLTGIKDSKVPAAAQDDIVKLFNITNLANQLAELDKKRIGGVISGSLGYVFGSQAQSEYLSKRKAIVDEIQRMQSGAALTETEQEFYQDYLPGRFSESFGAGQDSTKKIKNFSDLMNTKLENVLKNNNLSIYGYSKIKLGDKEYKVGDEVELNGVKGRLLPDGSISTGSNFNNVGDDTNKVSSIKLGSKLALKNNNPGNLRYIGQPGATPGAGGFAKFNSPEDGVRALYADIESKKAPGGKLGPNSTLSEFVGVYAPPSENDTKLYIQQLAQRLGVSPTTKISSISTSQLAREIAKKESSSVII